MGVIDYFALALTHGLLGIAIWRMLGRSDIDEETSPGPDEPSEHAMDNDTVPTYRDGRPKEGIRSKQSDMRG